MSKEEADIYVAHALLSYVKRATEETEAAVESDPDRVKRIPQLIQAYEYLQAAEHLLQEVATSLESK